MTDLDTLARRLLPVVFAFGVGLIAGMGLHELYTRAMLGN